MAYPFKTSAPRKKYKARRTAVKKRSAVRGSELSFVKRTMGRRKRVGVRALAKMGLTKVINRFQNVGPMDRGVDRGAFWLGPMMTVADTLTYPVTNNFCDNTSTLATNITEGYLRCPFHMYLLNSTDQNDGPVTIGLQPFINQATGSEGAFSYARLCGMAKDGALASGTATSAVWETEWTTGQSIDTDVKLIRQEWYDIRLGLRNAKAQTTFFDIMIVSFKDDYLDPLENPAGAQEIQSRRVFYQNLAARGMTHPIFGRPGLAQQMKHLNIHKRMRVVMNKQSTTDEDGSPDLKVVKLFYRDGRIYDYRYGGEPDADANVGFNLGNQNRYVTQGDPVDSDYACIPKPRARKWLVISAFDPSRAATVGADGTETSYGALSTSFTPSYDIIIRRKESFGFR